MSIAPDEILKSAHIYSKYLPLFCKCFAFCLFSLIPWPLLRIHPKASPTEKGKRFDEMFRQKRPPLRRVDMWVDVERGLGVRELTEHWKWNPHPWVKDVCTLQDFIRGYWHSIRRGGLGLFKKLNGSPWINTEGNYIWTLTKRHWCASVLMCKWKPVSPISILDRQYKKAPVSGSFFE